MIDIHSHILPNIDDGSKNIDETVCLIKEAKKAGFDTVVATPHYMEGYYETNEHERKVWMNLICQKLKSYDLDIKLCTGSEIYLSDNLLQLLEGKKASTINNTSYVLFELPLNIEPMNLYNTLYEGLKFANKNITLDQVYELVDLYYEEGGDFESLSFLVLEEYSKSMGLGKKFKEIMKQQQN